MSHSDTVELDRRHVWHPFTQAAIADAPIAIARAEGARLIAEDGSEYLDLVSSWWVNLHGHAHPAIAKAIADQAARLEQVIFADFTHGPAATLAARMADILPGSLNRVFFSDNGSTAVEVAMKMALQYWSNRGTPKNRFIAFEGGYHGDTVGAMSAGRYSGYFRAWESMLFPVDFAPFPATWLGDEAVEAKEAEAVARLTRLLEDGTGDIAAIIVEPLIQGAGGMRMCRPEFLRQMADAARAHGALVIFDEVMTGFGRTGALFACLGAGITPDLICLSKGLSAGFLPFAMTVATDDIHDAFLGREVERAFLHGHSFTANPLGCAAALASLDLLLSEECARARDAIEAVHARRLPALAGSGRMARPRWQGTVGAIDLEIDGVAYGSPDLKRRFREAGLLLRPLGPVLYLLPPYCVSAAELEAAYDRIEEVTAGMGSGNQLPCIP